MKKSESESLLGLGLGLSRRAEMSVRKISLQSSWVIQKNNISRIFPSIKAESSDSISCFLFIRRLINYTGRNFLTHPRIVGNKKEKETLKKPNLFCKIQQKINKLTSKPTEDYFHCSQDMIPHRTYKCSAPLISIFKLFCVDF